MNVNELLDTIEDTLEESTSMPLSGGKRLEILHRIPATVAATGSPTTRCNESVRRRTSVSVLRRQPDNRSE